MATKTYETTGTLGHDGEMHPPGAEVELTDDEAQPLLEQGAIREPGAGEAPVTAGPAEVELETHPLTAETIAEIEALVPEIDDEERLETALEAEETKGGREAIQERLDELADGDGE